MQAAYQRGMVHLLGGLRKILDQRHLYSIRTAFVSIVPIMIIGAFATVIAQLPIPVYQSFMDKLFNMRWRYACELVYNGTTQIVTLCAVYTISSNLAQWYNNHGRRTVHEGLSGMIALASYLILALPLVSETGFAFSIINVNGMFIGMLVAIGATEFFVALCTHRKGSVMFSDDPNRIVALSFDSIVPAAIVVIAAVVIRCGLVLSGVEQGLSEVANGIVSRPFQAQKDSLGTAQLFNISTHIMWLFGMHGNNVLDQVAQSTFVPAMAENVLAHAAGQAAPNLITKTMFDVFVYMGGSGATISLLIAILIFGKVKSYKTLFKFALPQALMNINEPVVFGLPIVLNPVFAVPFVLVPVVTLFTTALSMKLGWVPYTIAEVTWSMPIFFSGYIATGSVSGIVLQVVNLALGTLIYAPFVILSERLQRYRFSTTYRELSKSIEADYGNGTRQLTERGDEVGAVARKLANDLQNAIRNKELYLLYQPIVDARTNSLHSVEALLRWRHPEHGVISPILAIALAEEIGLINEIGRWVVEESIAQRVKWTREGIGSFHISVNASSIQLEAPKFADQVIALLERYSLPYGELQIEVTETLALAENDITQTNFAKLFRHGVTVAMDDFGVGHSSLMYLRTQPITSLKIDGALSREVVTSSANLEIISTIFELCKLFSMEMIVEYVEDREQLETLMSIGAHLIQGYYYSPPLPPEELAGFLLRLEERGEAILTAAHS